MLQAFYNRHITGVRRPSLCKWRRVDGDRWREARGAEGCGGVERRDKDVTTREAERGEETAGDNLDAYRRLVVRERRRSR